MSDHKPVRTGHGKFQKGFSGNPGGRPKMAEEVRDFAKNKSMEAMKMVYGIMTDESQRLSDRMAAMRMVMQAGGVFISQHKINEDKIDPLSEISAEDLKKFLTTEQKPS